MKLWSNRAQRSSSFVSAIKALAVVTIYFTAAISHAGGLSVSGAKAIDAMNSHFASVSAQQKQVTAAVDRKTAKLKAGVDEGATIAAARELFAGYSKAVKAASGLTVADKRTSEFQQSMKSYYAIRLAIVYIGVAKPRSFLSNDGRTRWDAIDSAATTALAQRKALKGAPHSMASEGKLAKLDNYVQRAMRGFKSLSATDRASIAGMGMVERIKAAIQFGDATRKRWGGDAAQANAARGKCKALVNSFFKGRDASHLEVLRELYRSGKTRMNYSANKAGSAEWVRTVKEMNALVKRLRPICDKPANKAWMERCKPTHGKSHMDGLYARKDPVVWCEVTRDLPKLIGVWLEGSIAGNDSSRGRRFDASSLERKKGRISDDSLRTWKQSFTLSEERKKQMIEPYLPIFAAAGIATGSTDRFFAGTKKRLAAMRKEVERLAPNWKRPTSKGKFYGVAKAKKQVKRAYGKVRIVAAGANPTWTITKNALGIPLHRSRGGWILFKVAGEKLCQQRGWGILENWSGRKYAKDNAVGFGSVRFQLCNR